MSSHIYDWNYVDCVVNTLLTLLCFTLLTSSISTSQIFPSWVAKFPIRPPMASLSRNLYDMPGLAPRMAVLFSGRRDSQIRFSNRDTSRNAWNRHRGNLWSRRGSYQTIWSSPLTKVKWHSAMIIYNDNPPLIRLYTKPWPYYRSRPFTEFWGFHWIFAAGVACRQGTLTSPDTWSRAILDLHMFYLLRPILFPNLSLIFWTMYFEHPSVLSRFGIHKAYTPIIY